jgi:endoglucanase
MRIRNLLLSIAGIASVLAQDATTTSAAPVATPSGVTGNVHYASLMNVSLWFYEAQRSGKLPSDNRVPW